MNDSYTRNRARNKRGDSPSSSFFSFLFKWALPFLIINGCIFFLVTSKPQLTIIGAKEDNFLSTMTTITIKSVLPTRNLTATMDGKPIELKKIGKKQYTATITKNGALEVSIENFNGMVTTEFYQVDVLDDNPPAIVNHDIEDGILTFELEDSQSGVDYASIYAIDSTQTRVIPLTVDKLNSLVTFTMDPRGLNVFVSDLSGHKIQATFTSHMEGGVEVSETTSDEVTPPSEEEEEPESSSASTLS